MSQNYDLPNAPARLSRLIDQIRIGYDQPARTGVFRGYVDDLQIVSG